VKQQFSTLCTVRRNAAGKATLKVYDTWSLDEALERFGDGEDLELHLEAVGRRRTHAQNRFFHAAVVPAFADAYGGAARAKTELCLLFIPVEHVRPDGAVIIVPGHTSALTVEEFNAFIEECIGLAAEHDIYIKDGAEWRAERQRRAQRKAS
jgi:hypothetical protein